MEGDQRAKGQAGQQLLLSTTSEWGVRSIFCTWQIREDEEKDMFQDDVDADITRWAGPDYNPNHIRHLLQNLHVRASMPN
eukprot:SAG31_NODE_16423_length_710_cov_0.723404_2_plen_80_part_00